MNNEMKYYLYHQNNSGGIFHSTEKVGKNVFIEAASAEHANEFAPTIGVYFEFIAYLDCACCGSRWQRVSSDEYDTYTEEAMRELISEGDYFAQDVRVYTQGVLE